MFKIEAKLDKSSNIMLVHVFLKYLKYVFLNFIMNKYNKDMMTQQE